MQKILTIANQKGGAGKTTTAAALAEAATVKGLRCLAIDLDPQGNLSYRLGATTTGNFKSVYHLLTGKADYLDAIQHTDGPDVIPASWELSTLTTAPGSARRLQSALSPLWALYDLIIIDTPPTIGELQYNALQASTDLLIPTEADIYSLQSVFQITGTAQKIQKTNDRLKVCGIAVTRYDGRSNLSKQMRDAVIDTANLLHVPYLGEIRAAVAVKEAAALQTSLYCYAPKSNPADDYMLLLEKIIGNREQITRIYH